MALTASVKVGASGQGRGASGFVSTGLGLHCRHPQGGLGRSGTPVLGQSVALLASKGTRHAHLTQTDIQARKRKSFLKREKENQYWASWLSVDRDTCQFEFDCPLTSTHTLPAHKIGTCTQIVKKKKKKKLHARLES